jgi:putative transposase
MSGSRGKKDQRIHRRSLRLPGYDYSSAGAYYVTLCTKGKACIFGEVFQDRMQLSDIGHIVVETWIG